MRMIMIMTISLQPPNHGGFALFDYRASGSAIAGFVYFWRYLAYVLVISGLVRGANYRGANSPFFTVFRKRWRELSQGIR